MSTKVPKYGNIISKDEFRLDSFKFKSKLNNMSDDDVIEIKADLVTIKVTRKMFILNNLRTPFVTVPSNINDVPNVYFKCGGCDRQKRYLYLIERRNTYLMLCKRCGNLKYEYETLSGYEKAREKVKKQLQKMGYDTENVCVDSMPYILPERIKNQPETVYQRNLTKLCKYQAEMREKWKRKVLFHVTPDEALIYGLLCHEDFEVVI